MNNQVILLKVQQRLNKLSSQDFANIQPWQIIEAFNKGQVEWIRRNARGANIYKEGAEQSTSRIDDLQKIIEPTANLAVTDKGLYFETAASAWPANYLRYCRFDLMVTSDCCPEPVRMKVNLGEVANVDVYLDDKNLKPSYPYRETFATISGNKIQLYHGNEFDVSTLKLLFYRQPVFIQIANVKDPYTGTTPTVDVQCEFKEDLIEVFIDETVMIIAGDTGNEFQFQRNKQSTEENN